MIDNNYITVKEYANRIGVSIFDVFDMATKGSIKTIEKDGICYVFVGCDASNNHNNNDDTNTLLSYIDKLQHKIIDLEEQIKEKDKIIAEFAGRFADIAQQSQQITTQTQLLQAVSEEKQGFFKRLLHRNK